MPFIHKIIIFWYILLWRNIKNDKKEKIRQKVIHRKTRKLWISTTYPLFQWKKQEKEKINFI